MSPTPSPLTLAAHEAGRKLQTLQLTNIRGNYADKSDATSLSEDLEAIWGIVDPMILALGEYAQEHFGFQQKLVEDHFTDVLRGALEGNATFVLDEAGDEAQAALCDNERSEFEEHNTLNRAQV